MTHKEFKRSINRELEYKNFPPAERVETTPKTVLHFTNQISDDLAAWLNHRFQHGVTLSLNRKSVAINSPLESNRTVILKELGEPEPYKTDN